MLSVRGQIARLPPKMIEDYLYKTIMVTGGSAIVPIVYLAMEAIRCIDRATDAAESPEKIASIDFTQECGCVLVPQNSIGLVLISTFWYKVMLGPFSRFSPTREQLMTLRGVPLRIQFIGLLLLTCGIACIYLFSNMGEYPCSPSPMMITAGSINFYCITLAFTNEAITTLMQTNDGFYLRIMRHKLTREVARLCCCSEDRRHLRSEDGGDENDVEMADLGGGRRKHNQSSSNNNNDNNNNNNNNNKTNNDNDNDNDSDNDNENTFFEDVVKELNPLG